MEFPEKIDPSESCSPSTRILAVDSNAVDLSHVEHLLINLGYQVLTATSGEQALQLYSSHGADMVLTAMCLSDTNGNDVMSAVKRSAKNYYIPVITMVSPEEEPMLSQYLMAGGDDFLCKPLTGDQLGARITSIDQLRDVKHLYGDYLRERDIIKKVISKTVTAHSALIDEVQVFSQPSAEISGDLILFGRHPSGDLVVLFADFVGHGLSAAIGVLPVAELFSSLVGSGLVADSVLSIINRKLHTLLPTGMYMAACMLTIDQNAKHVSIWNGGMPDIYILDGSTGNIRERIQSTHLPLGITEELGRNIELEIFQIKPGDHLLMHTDGLTDAQNPSGVMFGTEELEALTKSAGNGDEIFSRIVDSFREFCATRVPADDVTMVHIPILPNLTDIDQYVHGSGLYATDHNQHNGSWRWGMELDCRDIKNMDPVPIVMSQPLLHGSDCDQATLFRVLSELYSNAVDHGVLELPAEVCSSSNHEQYINARDKHMNRLHDGFVRIELEKLKQEDGDALLLRIEDSGRGFEYEKVLAGNISYDTGEGGIALVRELSNSLNYCGNGNLVEAVITQSNIVPAYSHLPA